MPALPHRSPGPRPALRVVHGDDGPEDSPTDVDRLIAGAVRCLGPREVVDRLLWTGRHQWVARVYDGRLDCLILPAGQNGGASC